MAWIAWPPRDPNPVPPGFRETVRLHVSQGGCTIIRTLDTVVVVGAGSGGAPDAGSRTVAPAIRAMGIGRVDAFVIVRPTLSCFSALPEVLRAAQVGVVLVDRAALDAMESDRDGPAGALLGLVRDSGVRVEPVDLDDGITVGSVSLPDTEGPMTRTGGCARRTLVDRGGAVHHWRWDGAGWTSDPGVEPMPGPAPMPAPAPGSRMARSIISSSRG